jgi:hypothetical protein
LCNFKKNIFGPYRPYSHGLFEASETFCADIKKIFLNLHYHRGALKTPLKNLIFYFRFFFFDFIILNKIKKKRVNFTSIILK